MICFSVSFLLFFTSYLKPARIKQHREDLSKGEAKPSSEASPQRGEIFGYVQIWAYCFWLLSQPLFVQF